MEKGIVYFTSETGTLEILIWLLETLYFMTASKEECDQWTKGISHIAGISIGYSSCVPVKPKRAGITRTLTLESYITGDQSKNIIILF